MTAFYGETLGLPFVKRYGSRPGAEYHRSALPVQTAGADDEVSACPSRLYEGRPLVKSCVRFLTPQLTHRRVERCRVKRLSKGTGVNSKGSWRLTRQREPGRGVDCHGPRADRAVGAVLISLSPHQTSRIRCHRGSLRWRSSKMGCQAARRKMAPAGVNGWLRVSMYQIAWVSWRARSICATLGPRWRPRRRRVRW